MTVESLGGWLQWLLLVAGAAGGLVLLYWSCLLPLGFLFGAPYVPTKSARVRAMLELAAPKPGELWVDLGSGDGRLLIAAARAGARAVGYEFHPLLVMISRMAIRWCGLKDLAVVHRGDLWKADVSQADVVSLYMMPYWMPRMEAKLKAELKPGCRIVSNDFLLPDRLASGRKESVTLYRQQSPPAS